MDRVINVSPKILEFLRNYLASEQIPDISENPIPNLLSYEIMSKPELLINCVFELETGEEVLISKKAIQDIKRKKDIHFTFIYDKKEITLSYDEFIKNFSNSKVFDYIEE